MSRELDEQCARALGWQDIENMAEDDKPEDWWGVPYANVIAQISRYASPFEPLPRFSEDPATTPTLLAEVARRGLKDEYVCAMCRIIEEVSLREFSIDDAWLLLTATPEQHARAFLEAIHATP